VLWCAFAVEDRPKGLRECPPAGLAPHWTPLLVLPFFFMLVLTLDLPEIGTIGVGTKFANPAKFLHFYYTIIYTVIYLTTFKRETTRFEEEEDIATYPMIITNLMDNVF